MRIIVGGMSHESNTLNPIVVGDEDFVVFHGREILAEGVLPGYSPTGINEALAKAGCEILPTVFGRAVPNGVISGELYARLKAEMIERIQKALESGPIDGACLALHGSMKVQGLGCAEGDILAAVRKLLPAAPITVALDMHATITAEMLANADGFVGYKTAPHVDCAETGAHAASMLLRAIKEGKRLVTRKRAVPVLIAGEKSETASEPMKSLIDECRAAEKEPGVLAASFLLGFPWADDEHECVTALVTTLDDETTADAAALRLARSFWQKRKEFVFRSEYYGSRKAIEVAYDAVLQESQKPVFVSDSGDNPTAGSTGDSTDLLEQVLATMATVNMLPTPLLYSGFYDVEATASCVEAGVGKSVRVEVGGVWDKVNGKRIPLEVEVLKIVRRFGPNRSDLALVKRGNLLLVLTSKHIGFGDEDLLPALGIEARDYCLVIVKLGYLEPCFRTIAARAILATSKGCSNEVLESIPFKKVRRPLYPLDPDMVVDLR